MDLPLHRRISFIDRMESRFQRSRRKRQMRNKARGNLELILTTLSRVCDEKPRMRKRYEQAFVITSFYTAWKELEKEVSLSITDPVKLFEIRASALTLLNLQHQMRMISDQGLDYGTSSINKRVNHHLSNMIAINGSNQMMLTIASLDEDILHHSDVELFNIPTTWLH